MHPPKLLWSQISEEFIIIHRRTQGLNIRFFVRTKYQKPNKKKWAGRWSPLMPLLAPPCMCLDGPTLIGKTHLNWTILNWTGQYRTVPYHNIPYHNVHWKQGFKQQVWKFGRLGSFCLKSKPETFSVCYHVKEDQNKWQLEWNTEQYGGFCDSQMIEVVYFE